MTHRALNSDLQKKAIKELNEDSKRIQEDLDHFRNWLHKQNHLTARTDDQFLITFLRGSKWSLQKSKERIDNYYTVRSLLPELYNDRDPFLPEIQNVLNEGIFYPLPKTNGPSGPRILYFNLSNVHPEKTPFESVLKVVLMVFDILLLEDDNFNIAGYQVVVNPKETPLSYFLQIPPSAIKKAVICATRSYPARLKTYTVINAPTIIDTLINTIVKPLLTEKLRKRVYVYNPSNSGKLYDLIDKSMLPQELGGQNGSLSVQAERWKEKIESRREWFLEDINYRSNEKLRIGSPKTYNENFGMEGTFRKLEID